MTMPLEEAVLTNPNIDDRDARLILAAAFLQDKHGQVTQSDLAKVIGCSLATVERRVRKLRSYAMLSMERTASRTWKYDFSGLTTPHLDDGYLEDNPNVGIVDTPQLDDGNPDKDTPHLGDPSPPILLSSYRDKRNTDSNLTEGREAEMARVDGPESDLKNTVERLLARPRKPKKETFSTKQSSQKTSHDKKVIDEYNCNDLWYVFREQWKKRKWNGYPTSWTARERKHMKDLIEEQGPQAVVKLLEYTFSRWEDLCRRYSINGFPSVPVIFGFRRSWMPEALNGAKGGSWGAEYTDSEEEIPSGSWG